MLKKKKQENSSLFFTSFREEVESFTAEGTQEEELTFRPGLKN